MIRRLELAIAIDAHRSFHRAARAMGISQPSLTRALQVLEGELGARLFERGKAECKPTEYGRVVLVHARRIVSEVAEAKRQVALLRGLELGEFRIGGASLATQVWLGTAIGQVSAAHPQLLIRSLEYPWDQLPDALMAAEIDVAVGESRELTGYPDIVVSRLPRRRGAVICRTGHPLTNQPAVGIDDLARFPLVGPRLPLRIAMHLPVDSALGSMAPNGRYFVPSILSATWIGVGDVVEESNAVGMVPQAALSDLGKRRELAVLPFAPPWLCTEQALMWRRDRMLHPALNVFRQAARQAEATAMGGASGSKGIA